MKLADLLAGLPRYELLGNADVDVRLIELDSRRVGGGEMFVCLEGLARNGHDFAAAAVANGATSLLVSHPIAEVSGVPQVVVPDTREAMARLAAAFFSYPARSLRVVGVTGTNGKTTVTHLIQAVVEAEGQAVDVMGTLGTKVGDRYSPTGFTTPESPEVQRLLRQSADGGAAWVAMEVSSHALAQKRTFATDFSAVVFTNLTQDHLDFHGDMESYFEAKAKLFTRATRGTDTDALAVINLEDPAGKRLATRAEGKVVTYGFGTGVDYRARRPRSETGGTRYELVTPRGARTVKLELLGRFNVENALAAQATAMELGVSLEAAVRGAERVGRIAGRMERVGGSQPFTVLVDFAHTPDALALALQAARRFTSGELVVVFGCGGDRDRGKRSAMGRTAATLADRVLVTSDNPRHEDPEAIIDDILAGVPEDAGAPLREIDRERAIRTAVERAAPGDTIVIAGKGHETYQIVGDETRPFDDREVAARALREIGFDVDDSNKSV